MKHVSGAIDSTHDGVCIEQISIHELQLLIEIAIGLANRIELGGIALAAHGASHAILAGLKEQKADPRADVASDSRDCHEGEVFNHMT